MKKTYKPDTYSRKTRYILYRNILTRDTTYSSVGTADSEYRAIIGPIKEKFELQLERDKYE